MLRKITVAATAFVALFAFACHSAFAGGDEWKAKMIADALTAAPPAVTNDATIYAWDAKGQMVLLRTGTGSYVCLEAVSSPHASANLLCPTRIPCALIKMPGNFFGTSYQKRTL